VSDAALRVVLLEDEPLALARLTAAVRAARPDVIVEATFDTVAGARAWFASHPAPDLVVSDIQLADGLAIALFASGEVASPVVFASAYDAYLMDAFRCAAVDYLLKPIATADVARALDKHAQMRATFGGSAPPVDAGTMGALSEFVREPRKRLLVRRGREMRAVATDDVAYLVAEEKLTLLFTRAGTEHVVDKTLSELEQELDRRTFFRANRATIVHVQAIRSFRSIGKGRLELTVEPRPKSALVVSQENGAKFRAWFDR